MSGLIVSGSINAYGNPNADKLLYDLESVGGNINIAQTGLTQFPSAKIKSIGGNVLISRDAPDSLLNNLKALKQNGVIKGEIFVYARGKEDVEIPSQDEKYSTNSILSLLCFGSSSLVRIVDSGEDLKPEDETEIDKSLRGEIRAIVDLLGAYFSHQTKVELYTQKIEYCARKIGIPFINLYRVVKIHETCHAAQHLGLDQRGDCIDANQFNAIPSDILEPLAEYWTWIVLSRLGSDGAIEAFFELDSHHPHIYRNWRQLNACHPEVIRMNWINLRIGRRVNYTFRDLL